uniref:HscB mitochondrial iron-sulfur cluster cochaperone n=1 Tax=Dromaius novaehollandiae TaxID=8790 RepID=A0A8C4JWX9_DRONO
AAAPSPAPGSCLASVPPAGACSRPGRGLTSSASWPGECGAGGGRRGRPRAHGAALARSDRAFRLDEQQLRRRFRSLQRALHPDRFGQRPPKEQYYSEQHSSLINRAYQTLLNPLSRGLYLLELNGIQLAQETDCDADSEFLMEIMEINEKLAEPNNEGILEEIETFIKVKQEELTKEVTAAFERDDLQEAKKLLAKMKYFANLEDKLKNKKIPS